MLRFLFEVLCVSSAQPWSARRSPSIIGLPERAHGGLCVSSARSYSASRSPPMIGLPERAQDGHERKRYRALCIGVFGLLLFALSQLRWGTSIERSLRRFVPGQTREPDVSESLSINRWWGKREPRFAYSTYATSDTYLCNALCVYAARPPADHAG